MRIQLVITGLTVGGAEKIVVALADRYAVGGNAVTLVRLHGSADVTPNNPSVRLENLGIRRNPVSFFRGLWRLWRLTHEFRPDVVNSHLVHANILTRLSRLFMPVPRLVSSAHNCNEEGRGRMIAYRLTDRLADISTNVSEEAVEAFEQQGALRPGRMVAIHNGIDIDHFSFDEQARRNVRAELGLNTTTPLLLAVGRLWEPKDYPTLLHAFSRLSNGRDRPHLAIVGDRPLLGELQNLAGSLGITD